MKRCETCEAPVTERRSTAEAPYAYTLGGLPHVGLVGVTLYECPSGHVATSIPRIGELHRAIVALFIHKPEPLAGAELRFLRKSAGFPAQKFAALLGVDPAHLSRVENGKQKGLGASTDRLARAIVLAAAQAEAEVRKMLLEEAFPRPPARAQPRRPVFALEQNRWKRKDAA